MPRLLFTKTGNAVWISHLDLMRLFQRAFKRAGLPLTHTKGFNPRPSVSIALPLSVGIESQCELLDFDLDGERFTTEEIKTRLNAALVDGITVKEVLTQGRKLKELAYLDCTVELVYDRKVPADAADQIVSLFQRKSLVLEKKNKNGITQQDIIPMIRSLSVRNQNGNIILAGRICCQNPTLNPMQLVNAIALHLPELTPDDSRICRLEILDTNQEQFR